MKNKTYIAGIYCRTNQKDHHTLIDQKRSLRNYAKENGFEIGGYYLDDGYSGVTLDRPAFKEMITDIENGKINCVIIKDLSRLCRGFLQTAEYTDKFFPEHNVRCIGVNDGYDSLSDNETLTTVREMIQGMM